MKKVTPKLVEQIINEWENITDTNQYRDTYDTKKELNEIYKKVADKVNMRS